MKKIILLLLALSSVLNAHIVEQLFADFSINAETRTWQAEIRFDAGIALPAMRADKEAPQPSAEWLTTRTPTQLEEIRNQADIFIKNNIAAAYKSSTGTHPLTLETAYPAWKTNPPTFYTTHTDMGGAYFNIILSGQLPSTAGQLILKIQKADFPDLAIGYERMESDSILTLYPGKEITLWTLPAAAKNNQPAPQGEAPTTSDSFLSFLDYGYRHVIPEGWDHVLFILALTCLTFAWKPLLTQSLIFTLGHTITLGLVVTGTIATPAPELMKWIEVLIAATILYVAIENIISNKVRPHRLAMIFIFGLIHGLGFASVLGDKIRASTDITLPLIAANLGVELGQITVIAAALLALFWTRKKTYFPTILKIISFLIAITAFYWVAQRIIS